MKFYNRILELSELNKLNEQVSASHSSRMTVITGRRRVGKTSLALEFARPHKYVYLFVSKKAEYLLCEEYLEQIRDIFKNIPVVGEIRYFKDIFDLLLRISQKEAFAVIIDEFQEFYTINPSVYSDIQKLWDLNKISSNLNVIFIGSVYSLIYKIFQNSKEPLFNRADRVLRIKPLAVSTIAEILTDYKVRTQRTLFDYYLFTGGSPRYIDLFIENKAFSFNEIIDLMISANSPFINEGKNLLIEEFGKEYGTYFSILELISSGKTSRSEIESVLEINTGGYLDRLENDYAIIARYKPVNAKINSKKLKYKIVDNFINFWFRFIYRHRSAVEIGNFEYIKDIVRRDYSMYAGRVLEQYFRDVLAETKQYNRIGSYWESGNINEIDIVAVNDASKKILIADVKMNKKKLDQEKLSQKAKRLLEDFKGYSVEYKGFSLEDVLSIIGH